MPPAVRFDRVARHYPSPAGRTITALHPTTFEIPTGSVTAIVGRSGSGKSTLLHLCSGIDIPSSGHVYLDGHDLATLPDADRTRLRRDMVGLVFQFFHLLEHLSVLDNVALPGMIAGAPAHAFTRAALELLEQVGLAHRAHDRIHALSGGERQRVAICRALLRTPRLVLADEPTGNLDDDTGREVMDLMLSLARDRGHTLIFVTHSRELAERADRIWTLHSGRLEP